jgi:hypothetical protein
MRRFSNLDRCTHIFIHMEKMHFDMADISFQTVNGAYIIEPAEGSCKNDFKLFTCVRQLTVSHDIHKFS